MEHVVSETFQPLVTSTSSHNTNSETFAQSLQSKEKLAKNGRCSAFALRENSGVSVYNSQPELTHRKNKEHHKERHRPGLCINRAIFQYACLMQKLLYFRNREITYFLQTFIILVKVLFPIT
jgi:hypothetical protein